jgi:hypothetical protein
MRDETSHLAVGSLKRHVPLPRINGLTPQASSLTFTTLTQPGNAAVLYEACGKRCGTWCRIRDGCAWSRRSRSVQQSLLQRICP